MVTDRPFFGERANYGALNCYTPKTYIYNFLNQNWIVTSSYLVKNLSKGIYIIRMLLTIPPGFAEEHQRLSIVSQ